MNSPAKRAIVIGLARSWFFTKRVRLCRCR